MLTIAKVDQRVEIGIGVENDITSPPAVSAVGAPILDIFFPPERNTAVAAVAASYKYFGLIKKLNGGLAGLLSSKNKEKGEWTSIPLAYQCLVTERLSGKR